VIFIISNSVIVLLIAIFSFGTIFILKKIHHLYVFFYKTLFLFLFLLFVFAFASFFNINIFPRLHPSRLNWLGVKLFYWTRVKDFTGCKF
jgi:hypothetical protein